MKNNLFALLLSIFSFALLTVEASVVLPKVLSSNMVLQRDMPVSIWGFASPGASVSVKFAGQSKTSKAGENGKWMVSLDPLKASFEPRDMKIVTADSDTVLENILVGEVWLCGGQSNMDYPMNRELRKYAAPGRGIDYSEIEWKNGGSKKIRLMQVDRVNSLPECTSKGWVECYDSTLAPFSAVGYYFGKSIQEELDVPVGLISSNWGGSRIERWTPASAYENSPIFAAEAAEKPVKINNIDVGLHFNSMIAPLGPYSLRGFIWYQGEANASIHDTRYVEETQLMLDSWRKVFNNPDAPLYFVQIAPHYYTKRKGKLEHTPHTLAEFCELQTKCLSIPKTGQVIITDLVDNPADIHPSYKWEVGRRLSLPAISETYGKKDLVYSGPVVKSMKIKKNKAIVDFNHIGTGLTAGKRNSETNYFEAVNEKLNWFEIAGEDGNYYPAEAVISGNKVLVSNENVKKPQHIRFAWNEVAMPNFFNKEGLPATPFRISGK